MFRKIIQNDENSGGNDDNDDNLSERHRRHVDGHSLACSFLVDIFVPTHLFEFDFCAKIHDLKKAETTLIQLVIWRLSTSTISLDF